MSVPIDQNKGYYFDELSKVRVVEPDTANNTQELKENCKEFVDKISDFQNLVGGFIEMVDSLAKQVESEKMKVIGARNKLKSIAKHRESRKQQLYSLIAEKKMELERLRIEFESLQIIEKEQEEFMEDFG